MFWSWYPLDLTVDWDRNDRLFCSRQEHKPRLEISHTVCVSLLHFFSISFLQIAKYSSGDRFSVFLPFPLGRWRRCIKIKQKEILILDRGSGYITPQTSLWITETNCFLATIPTWGGHVHSALCIPEESGYLMKKRLFCSASTSHLSPVASCFLAQGNLHIIFLFFISFLCFSGSTLFILISHQLFLLTWSDCKL